MSEVHFIDAPSNFSFHQTIYGHGWYQLLPFEMDEQNNRLSHVFAGVNPKKPGVVTISEDDGKIKIEILSNEVDRAQTEKVRRDVQHILRFDDDLQEFYKTIENEKSLDWIGIEKAGRLLRSPTVWEDLVKTICTTNCSWALTKKMTTNLVEKLGEQTIGGKCAFPTAEQMANAPLEFYKEEIRAGYRSAYFVELAQKAASCQIDPESWLDSDLPTKEIKKQMKSIKGVGDYAAENLLKLVGRYDGLALDSWLRARFYKKHHSGQVCGDRKIEQHYERFGTWRGLAIWCDLTER